MKQKREKLFALQHGSDRQLRVYVGLALTRIPSLSVCPSQGLVLSLDRIILAHSCQGLLNCSRKHLPFCSNNAPWTHHPVWKYTKIVYRGKKKPPKTHGGFITLLFPSIWKLLCFCPPPASPPPPNKQMQSRRNLFWTNSAKQFNNAILYKNT